MLNVVCCGGIEELNLINFGCLCIIILELGDNYNVNVMKVYVLFIICCVNVDFLKCFVFVLFFGVVLFFLIFFGLYLFVLGDLVVVW